MAQGSLHTAVANRDEASSTRALLVVAHPDDEYELAATVYRIAVELNGTVDQIIITDGEGGFRYSSLAARYYGINLTDEATGRANLPHIREEEARQAAKVLGIRHQWFLGEKDDRFTLSVKEALATWNVRKVSKEIDSALRKEHYDFVFVLLPASDEHGAHKAATILALQAVESLPVSRRPIVIGALANAQEGNSYEPVPGFPITATTTTTPIFHFDRSIHIWLS